ncbi:cytochrome c oxidase subunit II [Myxococcus fulvus]|uniref:cytochrome c oxidase subunit II n=1 Tax=Myxococcus TaxID=32 RepID=UPI0020BF1B7C|nr:cytochrome C oxidase subunit II [Myxococcus fulvus]MCK8499704.1 cytochrome C oxidase subunit II [Myxococcus fulvus]
MSTPVEGSAPVSTDTEAPSGLKTLALPENASTHGPRIDALLGWSHRFEAGLAAIALGWMLIAVWRFRGAKRAASDGGTKRSIAFVLGLALTTFLIVDGTLLVGSEGYLRDVLWNLQVPAGDPRTVRIEINAHQWSWEARYAGEDGRFNTPDDVVTWNDLRVPAGVPVWVQLVSTDVVHGFSLPHFRVKVDAIPGRVNQTWFQAEREGTWEVACYQHCGTSHYRMRGELRVLSSEAYAAWLREAGRQALQAYDADDVAAHWGWDWRTP